MHIPKIKVLIVDDHEILRQGLKSLLEAFDEFEVVGDTGDGRTALLMCNTSPPDVVVMDLLMPLMDGVTATRLMRNKFPEIEIVALTSSMDEHLIREALNAGVSGYVLKAGSIDDIADAIRAIYNGKTAFSSEAAQVLLSAVPSPMPIGHDLSKQEHTC